MQFLFVDRITHLVPKTLVQGIKHITLDDYYLCRDDTGNMSFISSLIGETLGQLAAWNVMYSLDFTKRPVAGIVSSARPCRPVLVGETLYLEAFIDHLDEDAVQYHGSVYSGDELVFSLDGALGPLLPMDEFIDRALVQGQFNQLHRPSNVSREELPKAYKLGKRHNDSGHYSPPMTFDAITHHEPGVTVCAEKRITRAAAYFPDHFPKKPVLPMTVLLECQLNLAHQFLAEADFDTTYQIDELRKIKMNEFVYSGDVVSCQLTIKRHNKDELILSLQSQVEGKRVCVLDIVMKAK